MDDSSYFKGGEVGFRFIPFDDIAEKIGVHVVLLRFFTALLAGYPFAFIYLLLSNANKTVHHIYFTVCGMFVSYFCFGSDSVYILISILVSYVSFCVIGAGIYNVIFTFVFQMGYLLGAYLVYASDGYDLKWTTPQCVLCLKLIGLAWDCYDGCQKKEKLRPYQRETCYEGTPSFLEIMGFSYFFGSFLAGPLFSFRNYIQFAEGVLVDEKIDQISRFYAAMKRVFTGVFAGVVFATFDSEYSCGKFYTKEFTEKPFFTKCTLMMLTYHVHFSKYIVVWMISESICIIVGLSYNGAKDGKAKWDGVRNFKFRKWLFGPFFQSLVESFNINTSLWSGKYIFRRLAFLGNKTLSHVLTLCFLSVWHGFYVGYAIFFATEFFWIIGEREVCGNLRILFNKSFEELPFPLRLLVQIFGLTFRAYMCGFLTGGFTLLRWERIKIVYDAIHYWGFIALALMFLMAYVTGMASKTRMKKEKES